MIFPNNPLTHCKTTSTLPPHNFSAQHGDNYKLDEENTDLTVGDIFQGLRHKESHRHLSNKRLIELRYLNCRRYSDSNEACFKIWCKYTREDDPAIKPWFTLHFDVAHQNIAIHLKRKLDKRKSKVESADKNKYVTIAVLAEWRGRDGGSCVITSESQIAVVKSIALDKI